LNHRLTLICTGYNEDAKAMAFDSHQPATEDFHRNDEVWGGVVTISGINGNDNYGTGGNCRIQLDSKKQVSREAALSDMRLTFPMQYKK